MNDQLTHSHITIPIVSYGNSSQTSSDNPIMKSPMPGKVIKFNVTHGDQVKKGDSIVILEAMKMEHVITAPCDG